jgi:hypothetical protein
MLFILFFSAVHVEQKGIGESSMAFQMILLHYIPRFLGVLFLITDFIAVVHISKE